MFLRMFLFFCQFEAGCSYKRCSWQKKRCSVLQGAIRKKGPVTFFLCPVTFFMVSIIFLVTSRVTNSLFCGTGPLWVDSAHIDACGLNSTSPLSHSQLSPWVEWRNLKWSGADQSRVEWSIVEQNTVERASERVISSPMRQFEHFRPIVQSLFLWDWLPFLCDLSPFPCDQSP